MDFSASFVIPFVIGCAVMFSVIAYKYVRWSLRLPKRDKILVKKNFWSTETLKGIGEAVSECLLHRRIFKINPVLGYMHMSLATGWFLLIVAGWVETAVYLGGKTAPLHGHVFFKYFMQDTPHRTLWGIDFNNVMDALLLLVLSGVALAWFKRLKSRMLGMKRTTRHTAGDRAAMSALWFVFPLRLAAESITAALYANGGFLTGTIGAFLAERISPDTLTAMQQAAWWCYSTALGVFFVAMPFSRYMHIFTEVPLIFMRRWGIRSSEKQSSFDRFQTEACSRCGICIDPCQLQSAAGIRDVQSVYFIRDRRYGKLTDRVADTCLMCGRCESKCPVGLELNMLRLNSREAMHGTPADTRYAYAETADRSSGEGKVGYFAGCMTLLSPKILVAMDDIFKAAGEDVWHADKDGGVCCGRPLKLSGEVDAARRMMQINKNLFAKHGIETLVTSCPICLKVFREDYNLQGIEVLHHSEYIERLVKSGRISPVHKNTRLTYHDPCELGRGCGVYEAPRNVLRAAATLLEPAQSREDALCCGASLAATTLSDRQQTAIARDMTEQLQATGAEAIVTACPLCKKTIARQADRPVLDIAEVISGSLRS